MRCWRILPYFLRRRSSERRLILRRAAAFVRLPPGSRFPQHTHHGHEWNLVLEGGLREGSGRETWPGEVMEI